MFALCWMMSANAQQAVTAPSLGNDIPTSPQAEAFKKLGEFSVDNAYGQPDITIPLWEIDHFGYKIPLVLRYQASPIKPGYNYDAYGLGWSLTGSSCVSRNIKGVADEEASDSYRRFVLENWKTSNNVNGNPKYYTHYQSRLGDLNTGYDDFTITLPTGRSIPFYISSDSSGRLIYHLLSSDQNVKIECNYKFQATNTASENKIMWFKVTDENGVVYSFDIPEKSQIVDNNVTTNVSWLLTKIAIPNKGTITYEYDATVKFSAFTVDEPVLEVHRAGQTDLAGCGKLPYSLQHTFNKQGMLYQMRFLKSISYGPAKISLTYNSDKRHVKSIVVKDSDGSGIIRKIDLNLQENSQTESVLRKLTITGSNSQDRLEYNMEYHGNHPGTYVDYWGNRGESRNSADVGNFNIRVDKVVSMGDVNNAIAQDGYVHRVDRRNYDNKAFDKINVQKAYGAGQTPDGRYATGPDRHAVLNRLTYPNGGRTEFEFERHQFLTANNEYGDLELDRRKQRTVNGGGFRIKTIKNYTAEGKLADYKEFKYGYTIDYVEQNHLPFPKQEKENNQTHTGLGEAVVDPNLLTFMDYEYSYSYCPKGFKEMMMNKHYNGSDSFENQEGARGTFFNVPWWYTARFSAAYFRKLLNGRPAVVYPEITIYSGRGDATSGNLSKTVLTFENIYSGFGGDSHYLTSARSDNKSDTLYFEPVRYLYGGNNSILETFEYPQKRGRLKSKAEYVVKQVYYNTYADVLISKEDYSYVEYTMSKSEYVYNNLHSNGHGDIHNLERSYGKNPEYSLLLSSFYSTHTGTIGSSKIYKTEYTNSRYSNGSIKNSVENSFVYGDAVRQTNYWNLSNKKNSYVYSADSAGYSSLYTDLKNRNILTLPLVESTYDLSNSDQRPTASFKTQYAYFGESILPKRIYAYNQKDYEGICEVVSYTQYGKPQEVVDLRTGVHTAYVWGYNGRYMIARVQNATYSQVASALGGSADMEVLRKSSSLTNSMIETWTYLPLVGVKTYTDVTGLTTVYEYDGLGRLKSDSIKTPERTEIKHSYEYNFLNGLQ